MVFQQISPVLAMIVGCLAVSGCAPGTPQAPQTASEKADNDATAKAGADAANQQIIQKSMAPETPPPIR